MFIQLIFISVICILVTILNVMKHIFVPCWVEVLNEKLRIASQQSKSCKTRMIANIHFQMKKLLKYENHAKTKLIVQKHLFLGITLHFGVV